LLESILGSYSAYMLTQYSKDF